MKKGALCALLSKRKGKTVNIDFAFICDYAEATGKINAMGIGFDTIYAPVAPCKHPFFYLVAQLRASSLEAGEKELEVHLIDEDGKDVIPPLKGKIAIPRPPVGTESIARVAMQFNNVEFPRYGLYSLRAELEGREVISIPLRISAPPLKR